MLKTGVGRNELHGRRLCAHCSMCRAAIERAAPRDGGLISGAGSQRLGDLDCTPLGRFAPSRDLLLCAKHLFVAARTVWARQEAAALRYFSPLYVRFGSFTSFPPSRRVRFAPRADIRPMSAFMSTRPSPSISPYVSRTRCSAKLLRSGAPLIRDRQRPERSSQVGFTRLAHF